MTQVIETDEAGRLILPAELLGNAKPHVRYTVASEGSTFVVQPELAGATNAAEEQLQTPDQWMQDWRELAEEIGKVWPAGFSAVDAVAEQRR